jgi:transposase
VIGSRLPSKYEVSDELWARIEPLLSVRKNTHPRGGGRPRKPDRDCMNAIFFVLRTGVQWNALNATRLCASSTAHDRFQEWVDDGVFLRLWAVGLMEYDE